MFLMRKSPRGTCIGWNLHNCPAQFLHSKNLRGYAQLNHIFPKSFSPFQEETGADWHLLQVSSDGGEVAPIQLPFTFDGLSDISPASPELLIEGPPNTRQGDALWQLPVPAGQPRRFGGLMAEDATWSPDGSTVYYSYGADIYTAKADGSQPQRLLTTSGTPFWVRVSPDGRLLRFSVYDSGELSSTLWEAHADGSHLKEMLVGWNNPADECCGNWTADGKYFVFDANREGIRNLWAVREMGDLWHRINPAPVQLTVGQMSALSPLPSRNGKEVYFIGATRRGELVRYDLNAHSFTPYLGGLSAEAMSFSKDGQKMAYVSFPEGILWASRTDGSDRHELTFPPMRVGLPRWSPDRTRIAFAARTPGAKAWQVFVIPAEGGDPEQLTSGGTDAVDPSWSPDGNSIVYGGYAFQVRGLQGNAIHILSLSTRQITAVPESAGLFSPRWSPDGRYLLAGTVDFNKLVLYDFTTGKWQDLVTMRNSYPNWSADGKCVYFNNPWVKALPVYRICLADRKLQHIADLADVGSLAVGNFGWWTALAPDDSILALRDISIEELYALDVHFQ
jgi:Tol biopolymer transport system component